MIDSAPQFGQPARMFHDHADYRLKPRVPASKRAELAAFQPEDAAFMDPKDLARFQAQLAKFAQDERDAAALEEQPEGKTMFVQTKSTPQRSRVGIVFTNNARRKVVVVNKTDEEVAALNATGGADMPNPDAKPRDDGKVTTEKVAVCTPLGAKAILSDDALLVYEQPAAVAEARVAQLEQQIADQAAALAAKDAELANLRAANGREGSLKSARLDKGDAKAAAQAASDAKAAAAASDTQVDALKK